MIPNEFLIKDTRNLDSFKNKTFSNYSKKEVIKALNNSMLNGLIEESCYWSAELLCSGQLSDLINQLILFSSNYVNITCSDISKWVIDEVIYIIRFFNPKFPLSCRNDQCIRNRISYIIFGLCISEKNLLPSINIVDTDLTTNSIRNKIMHKSVLLVDKIINKSDPPEIKIVGNEFANHLRKPGSMIRNKNGIVDGSIYWLYWILKWDKMMLKKNKNYKCASRKINNVHPKFYNDVIWIVWNIIFNECKFRKNKSLTDKIIVLFNLYIRDYKNSYKHSRVPHIVHALLILQNKKYLSSKIPIDSTNYFKMVQTTGNINSIYRQIKTKSEVIEKNYESLSIF